MPTTSMTGGSWAPMENSPPGIQAIASGAGPPGGFLFSTVGAKPFVTGTNSSAVTLVGSLFPRAVWLIANFQTPSPPITATRHPMIFSPFVCRQAFEAFTDCISTVSCPALVPAEFLVVGIGCCHLELLGGGIKNRLLHIVGTIGQAVHMHL